MFAFLDFSFEKLVNLWIPQQSTTTETEVDRMVAEPDESYIGIIQNFTNTLLDYVETMGAKRLVIDPISTLKMIFPNHFITRRELIRIFNILRESKCTTLILSELAKDGEFSLEEFIASGVIRLFYFTTNAVINRRLVVYKMRGTPFNEKVLSMRISQHGIELMGETLGMDL
jgi:KaiC/GvpD/RAD55 family RecA-like ATPase